jgi:hypothetical protein
MKLNNYLDNILYAFASSYYDSRGDQGGGSSMKNLSLVSAKYCGWAFSISSVIGLLLFAGCSSIDGTAENHRVTANLVTSHVEPGQEGPEKQPVNPEPSYEWWY